MGDEVGLLEVEVGEDEEAVFLGGVLAEDGDDVAGALGDDAEGGVGVKGGVDFEEGVEAADPVDLVGGVAPVEAVGVVYVDLLGGVPFESVGEAEGAVEGGEGAEGGAEAGEGGGGGGEAGVVVGFGEVDEVAFGAGGVEAGGEVVFELLAVVVLEDFGVGPVHAGGVEELFGDGGIAAEAFEHEDGLGVLEADFGDDVFPGGGGDFVAGVAAEAVDAVFAPEEEDVGHVGPEVAVGEV